ncbi:hypothetical protein TSMEX_010420 [Taenia solium]|eukprot:TsM_001096200 transcript=TsM_001096200 gene=TsM_001096200
MKDGFSVSQGNLGYYDCKIYTVDPLRFHKDELTAILESLTPHELLIVAVVVSSRVKSSRLECLVKFLQSLGGFDESPLAAVPTNWRLWCLNGRRRKLAGQWAELLQWGCYDVISKRNESNEFGRQVLNRRRRT